MPTYEYACRECEHHFEVVQSFKDDPLTDCPNCSVAALRKVFHPIGISFKGSGFYKTDSRSSSSSGSQSSGEKKSETKAPSDSSSTSSSSSSKADTKKSSDSSSSSSSSTAAAS